MANVHEALADGITIQTEGRGKTARTLIRSGDWTFTRWSDAPDDEPRIRDIDLAERLGFDRPVNIRNTIKRTFSKHERPYCRSTVKSQPVGPKGGGTREFRVDEFWLTEEEALEIAVVSQTPKAKEIRRAIIRVFVAVRRGLLAQPLSPAQVLDLMLAPEFLPPPKNGRFKEQLWREIYRLKGKPYPRGISGAPQGKWLGRIIEELFYLRLTGDSSLIDELRRRNPADERGERRYRHHCGLAPEIADGPLRDLVDVAVGAMRGFADGAWSAFVEHWDRRYPLRGRTTWLPVSLAPRLPAHHGARRVLH